MKKSELTISMPLTTYEELTSYKEYYENIKSNLESLLNPVVVEASGSEFNNGVILQKKQASYYAINTTDLVKFIKSYLPYKYHNETILLNED